MLTIITALTLMFSTPERALPPGKFLSPHHITRSLSEGVVKKPPYPGDDVKG